MFGLGYGEILILAFLILLLFGAKRIPQLGNSFGKAITNFKKGLNEENKIEKSEETKG